MGLIDNLKVKSEQAQATLQDVENEIYNYFVEKANSEAFDKHLEEYISSDEIKKREAVIPVEFWDYNDGCSDTRFRCLSYRWDNPDGQGYDSRVYKGIYLYEIQKTLGPRLLELTRDVLCKKGFCVKYIEDKESWLKYYHKNVHIVW